MDTTQVEGCMASVTKRLLNESHCLEKASAYLMNKKKAHLAYNCAT